MQTQSSKNKGLIGVRSYARYPENGDPPKSLFLNHRWFQQGAVRLPERGLTMLYGIQISRKLLGSLLHEVESNGDVFVPVHGQVDIGESINRKVELSDLPNLKFLCFPDRTKADLMNKINKDWTTLLARHGLPSNDAFPRKPSPYIHLLDELFRSQELAHISAVAYPVETKVGICRLVTIFDYNDIHDLTVFSVENHELDY